MVGVHLPERRLGAASGAVHEDIDGPELVADAGDAGIHGGRVAHVEDERERRPTGRRDCCRRALGSVLVPIVDRYNGTLRGEDLRNSCPGSHASAPAAGDQGDSSIQPEHHSPSSPPRHVASGIASRARAGVRNLAEHYRGSGTCGNCCGGCGQGKAAADYIAKRVPKGKVIVIGGPPVPAITNYTNCFVKSAKADGLKIVGKQYNTKDTAATAQPIVQDLLTKNPDTNAIWCYNDPSCLGAGAVVKSAGKKVWKEGKQKGVVITGANGSADAAAGVKAGLVTGTWDPQPSDMGRIAVEILAMHLKQGKPLSALPKIVVVPNKIWDASNISGYVDPKKRPVKLAPIPASWIVKH